jgi:hypothetical protein
VFYPGLVPLKRDCHVENGLSVLHGYHAAAAETAAVPRPINQVIDRRRDVATAQEVSMQRVRTPVPHRTPRRHQRLPEHLPAENLRRTNIAALAMKAIFINLLEPQEFQ